MLAITRQKRLRIADCRLTGHWPHLCVPISVCAGHVWNISHYRAASIRVPRLPPNRSEVLARELLTGPVPSPLQPCCSWFARESLGRPKRSLELREDVSYMDLGVRIFFWEHLSWIHPEIIKHKMPHAKVVLRMLCWSLNINFMTGTRQKKTWDFVQDGVWLEYWMILNGLLTDILACLKQHLAMFVRLVQVFCAMLVGHCGCSSSCKWIKMGLVFIPAFWSWKINS